MRKTAIQGQSVQQLIPDTTDIDDADLRVAGELVAQLSNEHVEAALVEETVIAPEVKQDALHTHHLALMLAQAAQQFRLTERKLHDLPCQFQSLERGMEQVFPYLYPFSVSLTT